MAQPLTWGNYGYWKQTFDYHPRIPSASAVGVSTQKRGNVQVEAYFGAIKRQVILVFGKT